MNFRRCRAIGLCIPIWQCGTRRGGWYKGEAHRPNRHDVQLDADGPAGDGSGPCRVHCRRGLSRSTSAPQNQRGAPNLRIPGPDTLDVFRARHRRDQAGFDRTRGRPCDLPFAQPPPARRVRRNGSTDRTFTRCAGEFPGGVCQNRVYRTGPGKKVSAPRRPR